MLFDTSCVFFLFVDGIKKGKNAFFTPRQISKTRKNDFYIMDDRFHFATDTIEASK
jgi:hypothetical protein